MGYHAGATRVIEGKMEAVWPLFADVTQVEDFHPMVKSVDVTSADKKQVSGVGAGRRCNLVDGTSIVETVTACEDQKRVHLVMSDHGMPMKSFEGEIRVSSKGDGKTEVTMDLEYVVKYGLLGKLLARLVMQRKRSEMCALVLAGAEHHLKTGESVGQDFKPPKSK